MPPQAPWASHAFWLSLARTTRHHRNMLRMQHSTAAVSFVLLSYGLRAANLKPETKEAWDSYMEAATAAMQASLQPGATFLWLDEEAGRTERVRTKGPYIAQVGDKIPK